ncbi:MAG: trypsin-like peptidase domain-containing protein [Oscillospiraceae bacterium]|nr:trypsin-like peptidase domain-containing protein [Oscillospiraceae bacterium]
MESYFNQNINITKRFFFVAGKTQDEFCGEDLIRKNLDEMLYDHLSDCKYSRIIFYNRSKKFYFFDDVSYMSTANLNYEHFEQVKYPQTKIKLKGAPLKGRLNSTDSSAPEKSQPPKNQEEANRRLSIKTIDDTMAFSRIKSCMEDDKIKTAVIFTNADDFISSFGRTSPEDICDGLNSFKGLSSNNKNIVVFVFPEKPLEEVLKTYESDCTPYWKFFSNMVQKDSKSATLIELNTPSAGEIRNAIHYKRLLSNGLKVDFREFDDVCKNLTKHFNDEKLSLKYFLAEVGTMSERGEVLNNESCEKRFNFNGKSRAKIVEYHSRLLPALPPETRLDEQLQLNELIGLAKVKSKIEEIKDNMEFECEDGKTVDPGHYVFNGNPGTGKTTVARLLGSILHNLGVLKKGHIVEIESALQLTGEYAGHSKAKTQAKFNEALDGVLFIDEAYSINPRKDGQVDYGQEVIDTLVPLMENNLSRICVIFAGYTEPMKNFIDANVGLFSRVTEDNIIEFENYTSDELVQILRFMAKAQNIRLTDEFEKLSQKIFESWTVNPLPSFGNGRDVRNYIKKCKTNMRQRLKAQFVNAKNTPEELRNLLTGEDVPKNYDNILNIKDKQEKPVKFVPIKFNEKLLIRFSDALIFIQTESGSGSGFVITEDGYAITAYHVVEGQQNIEARLRIPDRVGSLNSWHEAVIVKYDKTIDIALLKLKGVNFPAVKLATANLSYNHGDKIYCIGYPFGDIMSDSIEDLNHSTFYGAVSGLQKRNGIDMVDVSMEGKRGNSGCPVLSDETNEVIGVFRGAVKHDYEDYNNFVPIKYIWQEFLNPITEQLDIEEALI